MENSNWDNIREFCDDLDGDYEQNWYDGFRQGDERCELEHPDGEIGVASHSGGQLIVEFPGGDSTWESGFMGAQIWGAPDMDDRDTGSRTLGVTGESESVMEPGEGDTFRINDFLLPEFLGESIEIDTYSDDMVYVGGVETHNPSAETTIEFANGMVIEGGFESDGWKFDAEKVPDGCDITWKKRQGGPEGDNSDRLLVDCDEEIGGFRTT